jgi:hypothetical protein
MTMLGGSTAGGGAAGGDASGGSGALGGGGGGGVGATDGSETLGGAGGTPPFNPGGSGGAAGMGGAPPGPIDYSMWSLQLPIGSGSSPTTIPPKELLAGFMNEYFYPAPDGGQMFMDPNTGITTSGSQHCRTELREANPNGGQAEWSASAVNRMTVEGQIVKGGSTITIGQVLNGTDSIPLLELEWSSGRNGFQAFYEESKGNGENIDLKTPWKVGQRYTFALELSQNQLSVSINGKQVYTRKPSSGTLAKTFYFKFGNYDQNSSAGPVSTTPHSIVEAYSASVLHQ